MNSTIRDVLAKFGQLPVSVDTLADDADLYAAGLSSFASVQLMLKKKLMLQLLNLPLHKKMYCAHNSS